MNNFKELIIFADGGEVYGFGHITRCLSISHEFINHNYKIKFIINGDKSVSNILKDVPFEIIDFHKDIQLDKKISNSCSIILIDSMIMSNKQILQLEKLNIPIVFIDDEKRKNILNKGFVLDWTVLSDTKNYFNPIKPNITYLLGSKYTPLRSEFNQIKQNKISKDIKSILVTFGGSDIRNLTPMILNLLNDICPNVEKNIVIGAGFNNIEKIKKLVTKNTNLIFEASSKIMISLMQKSDIAIASGGQTLYELARVGTPTIAILLVENAKDDTEGWDTVGSVKNIGWWDDENLSINLKNTLELLEDYSIRETMQNSAKKYINPNGAKLLVDSILERL